MKGRYLAEPRRHGGKRSANRLARIVASALLLLLAATVAADNDLAGQKDAVFKLSVMTWNIGDIGRFPQTKDIVAILRDEGIPDLLLLQEVRGRNKLDAIADGIGLHNSAFYHYRNRQPNGIAILSRYPLKAAGIYYFKNSHRGYGVVHAVVEAENVTLLACSLHVDRVELDRKVHRRKVELEAGETVELIRKELLSETVRSRCVDELLEWLSERGAERTVIGGDFNTIPFSRPVLKMQVTYGEILENTPDFLKGTYPNTSLSHPPRLDYIFHSRNLTGMKGRIIEKTPGDHYPVAGEVEIGREAGEG